MSPNDDAVNDATDTTDDAAPSGDEAVMVDDAATDADAVDSEPVVAPDPDAVTITINGREVSARRGELVISAAERNDAYIPRFCYHPRMSSVGMCRQCLVEIDTGRGPMLQPSCMVPVSDGMVVDTESDTSKRAQEGILELLLANHPLDCPVCDKGGECPLQDQAFSHGPGESRYVEEKRHYEKPIPISDLVFLDRERCILCDRCTRFADEVAGDALIHFMDRGNATQVNTYPDEPFSSYFSGNTVQICPVGALTASPYRFKARPWDLEQVESTCTTCSVGCRTSVHSSRDRVLRFQGLDVSDDRGEAVNHGWLCDRGRFNFESVHADSRLGEPLVRTDAGLTATTWSSAMSITADLLGSALAAGSDSVGIIGGARGTNEDALAWARLADACGVGRRDAQVGDGIPAEILDLPRASVDDACAATTIVLIGPDLKQELPVLHLRLRAAVESGRTKVIEFTPTGSGLTATAWRSQQYVPGALVDTVRQSLADGDMAAQLAAGPVVVVAGRSNLAEQGAAVLDAVEAVVAAAPQATVLPVLRRGNVIGALEAGLAPVSGDTDAILRAAADGQIKVLVLLGADPLRDHPDAQLARRALAGAERVISIDGHMSLSSRAADVVLPAAVMGEKAGTTTNIEGRTTPVEQKVTVHGTARPDWMIALELAQRLGHDLGVSDLKDLTAAVPHAERHRSDRVPAASAIPPSNYELRLIVSRTLYDAAVLTAASPSLAELAAGPGISVHPADLDALGVPSGDEIRVVGPRGSVILPACADDRLRRGTVWAAFNQVDPSGVHGDIRDVIDASAAVNDVRLEVVS
ncbi:MAG: NADH-quinone oxidoreductase subunit NuoG [Actinomycetota bacterium]|nr:NADH-quinone oxidoreductase subunit NuoG [Actinomycetota bacterium]MDA3007220.1 NADH-quinone oxidoreductase subunit NuoG [Actinomycetota bacterium]MDA3034382.1 NADH-quinone oxidoreductase subunit NuoG [Actinomycetota bacterium]